MHPEWWFAAVPALCAGALMPVAIGARRHLHLHPANGRVASRLWVHSFACLAMAVAFYDNTYAQLACLAGYTLFYTRRYRAPVRFGRPQVQRVHPRAAPQHAWSQALRDPASRREAIA